MPLSPEEEEAIRREFEASRKSGHEEKAADQGPQFFEQSPKSNVQHVVGVVSGNDDPDKIAKTGWTVVKAENVNAPYFEELPMTLECILREYDEKNCYMYGKIVNVSIDESVLTDGKPDPDKMGLIAFDQVHGKYRIICEVVGNAFEAGFELNK